MPLDPTLQSWRDEQAAWLASLGDPLSVAFDEALLARAKSMDSPSRTKVWERFREIQAAGGAKRSIAENKWAITLISADRADNVKAARASKKEAKATDASKAPTITLDSILKGLGT